MRIAISCHPSQGGSGIVATELALSLAARGHEIHMISCDRPFRFPVNTSVQFHKVNIPDYPLFIYPPHDLSLVNKMAEIIQEKHIDIIHAHYAVPHAICAIMANNMVQPHPVKTIATMHGTDITLVGSHPDYKKICTYAIKQCDGLSTVSAWLSNRTFETFDIPQAPKVIHNFFDPTRFNPTGRASYPDNEPFVIMHASNFRPVKRTEDVIRVFHKINLELPARLILQGTGPALGLAKELCAELNLCEKVDFAGSRMNIENTFKQSHLFLLLSDYESFGLSALEAMACGTPVAVSNSGGLPEFVSDNITGLLCQPGDIDGTARRIVNLLKNQQMWETMSCNIAAYARRHFAVDVIVPQYEAFYEEVLRE